MAKVNFIAVCLLIFTFLACQREVEEKCNLSDLRIEKGECHSDNTYKLILNFKHRNRDHDLFEVYIRNNKKIGTYKFADLPLTIQDFNMSGKDFDYIKIVIKDKPHCFLVAEFKPPMCEERTCSINELRTEVGECHSDGTFDLTINFNHHNAGNEYFNVYTRDGKLIGTYKLANLPITIKNFKRSGNDHDFIKVVINDKPDCFAVAEFKPPAWEEPKCSINELRTEVGECHLDGTFDLKINFNHHNAGNENFNVYTRDGKLIGTYKLANLPVTIKNFKRSGNDHDFIKVVINDKPDCFAVAEFKPPACEERKCSINELRTEVGECHSDGTFDLKINFNHHNAGNEFFNVYTRDGKLIGTYKLANLPVTIKNFKRSGNDHDFIKVVINHKPDCFAVAEFKPPACEERKCSINELRTEVGECHSDGTFDLKINFNHHNAGNEYFNVYTRDGKLIGTYKLANLPITIKNFKRSGNDHDFIKVVINHKPDCFAVAEFKPPACEERKCSINELRTEVGECHSDGTFDLKINFNHHNAGNEYFNVYTRDGKLIGTYKLANLPVTIKNFKRSGNDHDFIKVVINHKPDCFAIAEFKSPACEERKCSISELVIHKEECTSDSTYHLTINFKHQNAGNEYFEVFTRNNIRLGTYKLSSLPLKIRNFKKSGRDYDFLRVCINDKDDCCKAIEFITPDCRE